tara:strand:+ start:38 stop:331 length:294 start_codon:yes stop_codon:yes gene_type:complete
MIDKINNINSGNAQRAKVSEETKSKKVPSSDNNVNAKSEGTESIKIDSSIKVSDLSKEPPLDVNKVNAIKKAISDGNYPINLEKVADALLQAYKDIK